MELVCIAPAATRLTWVFSKASLHCSSSTNLTWVFSKAVCTAQASTNLSWVFWKASPHCSSISQSHLGSLGSHSPLLKLRPVSPGFFGKPVCIAPASSQSHLAKMVTLRATSMPARSSLGSGSVYPSSLAVATTSENLVLGVKELKM